MAMDTDDIGPIKDCIGCGFCCREAKCAAGARLYPSMEICGALKWNGERHICDLMTIPGLLGDRFREELYAGEGCCSNLNSWRNEPLEDRTQISQVSTYVNPIPSIMQQFLGALGRQFMSSDIIVLTLLNFKDQLEKDGMPKDEAEHVIIRCSEYLQNQRSKFSMDFMG